MGRRTVDRLVETREMSAWCGGVGEFKLRAPPKTSCGLELDKIP
ncbi:MAG: hypothetical protein ACI9MB_004066, partial [Verrucomicrobiales bacterium]